MIYLKIALVHCKILINFIFDRFCTPADVEQEAGDGKGPGKLTGGMGLADGEGEKDVSDQIETQVLICFNYLLISIEMLIIV